MRKKFWVFVVVGLLALSSCGQTGAVEIRQIMADRLNEAGSVPELQAVSDIIVVFEPSEHENNLIYYTDGNVSVGYTKTSGRVIEVLKGGVSVGDIIQITEECYTTDEGTVLWTQGGYLPMVDGENYLLFLRAYAETSAYAGMYYPIELEYGKYRLPTTNDVAVVSDMQTAEMLEVGSGGNFDIYEEWYSEVSDLYPSLFKS